MKKIIFTGQ